MPARFAGALVALSLAFTAPASAGAVTASDTSRIVAIGGSVTEILYALGLEDRVVAVDLTSTFPERARAKPSAGYMRTLSPEGVLSVNPSVVIAIEGSGPPDAMEVLEKASVPFVLVPEAHDGAGVAAKIRFIADLVGEHDRGEALADAVLADLATLATETAKITKRRKAVFVLSTATGAPMVAGQGTVAEAVFGVAGIDNALTGFTGYKAANEEATLAAEPDAVVMMAERGHGLSPEIVFAAPAFAGTPAARAGRLISLSGPYLLGLGPRVAHAARDLAAGVYPELDLAALPPRPWTEESTSAAAK